MAGFGTRTAAELQTKAQVVLERKAAWMQHYPQALPAQSIALNVDGITLTGTLEGLLCSEGTGPDAGWLQLSQRVGAVLEGQKEAQTDRIHVVTALWVHHLAACASGMPLTSVQLGLDGQVVFRPLAPATALPLLQRLVQVYREAWERPLPAGCKTAWAYIQAQTQADRLAISQPDKEPKDPHEAAQVASDGGHHAGERSESAYLARAFARYEDIEDELPGWATQLYGDMARQVQLPPVQEHAHN